MGNDIIDDLFRDADAIENERVQLEDADMDKPRICEVLKADVGETITYKHFDGREVDMEIQSNGLIFFVHKKGSLQTNKLDPWFVLVNSINHPDRIICKPKQEQEEKKVDKPLKDWTLGELKEYCETAVFQCHKGICPFQNICDRITSENQGDHVAPGDWDLTDKPRFTEQEVEDAKTLLRVFPERLDSISRSKDGTVTLAAKGAWRGYLNKDAFSSIHPGQSYTFDEIIRGGE